MKFSTYFASTALAVSLVLASGVAAQADYPDRPIQMLVPWGAGGGSDAVARIIASLMEKDLGQPIAVINRAGGNGAVGHQAIASAKPDGYTIGMATMEITTMHWMGFSPLKSDAYVALGQVNYDPAAITVSVDSPFQNAQELLDAVKKEPGKFKTSGGGVGAVPHVGIVGLLKSAGMTATDAPFVPTDSAATGLQELVSGGVHFVGSSLGETRSLVDAGKVRTLAVMSEERLPGFDVPTVNEATDVNWSYSTWRGFVAPKGIPDEARDKLQAALEKAYNSPEYTEFMNNRGFGMKWRNGEDFTTFMVEADQVNGDLLKEIGLAK